MLKNFKVTTKLVAILVAPVLVLVALAYVGVRQRLSDASEAQRVQQLTEFAGENATLINEMQIESLYSAVVGATRSEPARAQLTQQRAKTDAAIAEYRAKISEVEPGRDDAQVAAAIKQGDIRLNSLPVTRKSVDQNQTEVTSVVEQFDTTQTELWRLNQAVANSVQNPELSRAFASVVRLESISLEASNLANLLAIAIETGYYPAVLPNQSSEVASRSPAFGVGCGEDAKGAGADCPIYQDVVAADADAVKAREDLLSATGSTPSQKSIYRVEAEEPKFEALVKQAVDGGSGINDLTGINASDFVAASVSQANKSHNAGTKFLLSTDNPESVYSLASAQASEAQREATLYALFTAIAIALAAIITLSVARAITGPLRKLTSAAYTLSTERLPALVERLRNPEEDSQETLAASLTPIDIHSKDEIGQLADSFNSIQQVTVEVAEEQSVLLRKGIGDIFINLARRNQTLLDRQIEFIDQLEANEEDPDQLDNLFKLDHLATRMRRNAESLLVLAGAEPPRRRGRPVALADVVRVAIGEVEDFARIQLLALDDATVGGNVAVDLAHLLSELMENATHFSPPDTMVEIVGHRSEAGYIISVSDQGIGMSAEQLAEANHQLARPPLVGLALSRSLGFIVIGRLSQRFEISVKLTASPSGGVTALVTLPADLVTYEGEELPPTTKELPASAKVAEPEPAPVVDDVMVIDEDLTLLDDATGTEVEDAPVPEPVAEDAGLLDELVEEGMADSDEFERGLQEILSDDGPGDSPAPTITAPEPAPKVSPRARVAPITTVAEQITAASRAEAKEAELTAAGLVKRTPKKQSEVSAAAGAAGGSAPRATGASQRSPEEVRKMLSRYRSGLNKGRTTADSEKTDS